MINCYIYSYYYIYYPSCIHALFEMSQSLRSSQCHRHRKLSDVSFNTMMLNNNCNMITLVGWYGCRYVVIIRSMFLCAISGAFTGLAISMNNSVPAKEREQNKSTTEKWKQSLLLHLNFKQMLCM